MRKSTYILLAALAFAAAVSCTKEIDIENQESTGEKEKTALVFTAHVDGSATSKTSLDGVDVVWSEKDLIDAYVIVSELGWERLHSIRTDILEDGSVARFSFGQGLDDLFGIEEYEYDSHVYSMKWYAAYTPFMDYDNYPYTETLDGIPVFIPSTQYVPDGGGFADGANVAVAYVSDPDNVQFKNVGGLVAVKVKGAGEHEIVSILLSGTEKNGGSMTGQAVVQVNASNAITSTTCSGEDYVQLAKPNLAPLSIDKTFYAVVAPGTYTDMTITFTDEDGNIATYTKKTDLVVTRNSNQLIGGFDIPEDKWTRDNIVFVDENVKALLVNKFDTDDDGELSYAEAETVTSLDGLFNGCGSRAAYYGEDKPIITSFNEFRFFTGITSLEDGAFYNCDGLTSIMLPNSLTSIGAQAFSSCERLESITLPSGLETIGDYAFWGCDGLAEINIPEGVTSIGKNAFVGAAFTSLVLPETLESIGQWAFSGCESLSEINLPERITTIERGTFNGCSALTSFVFPDGLQRIEAEAFRSSGLTEITWPEGTEWSCFEYIGSYAFAYCPIEKLVFPESVWSVGTGVFQHCWNLKELTIPDGVTELGEETFAECTSLTSVTIPKTVWYVGKKDFYKCTGLTEVVLLDGETEEGYYDGVNGIEEEAFAECKYLESVTIPKSVSSIGEKAFYKCTWLQNLTVAEPEQDGDEYIGLMTIGGEAFAECTHLQSFAFPLCLTRIGDKAFSKTGLKEVSLNGILNLETLGEEAFSYCPSLRKFVFPVLEYDEWGYGPSIEKNLFKGCEWLSSVTIPEGLFGITEGCFDGCVHLVTIELPASINWIGDYAFRDCGLTSLVIPGDSFCEIGSYAFQGCASLASLTILDQEPDFDYIYLGESIFENTPASFRVYVPENLVEDYKSNEYWEAYAGLIEAIPSET